MQQTVGLDSRRTSPPQGPWAGLGLALLVGLGYYAASRIGFSLTFAPVPVSILWAPNALLLGALVLTARRLWWAPIAGAFVAHLFAQVPAGVPIAMVLGWFVSNTTEALIGAAIMVVFADGRGLRTLRSVITFCCAAVISAFLSSFLDAAFVRLVGWGGAEYGTVWQVRFFSNLLATITIVPVLISWSAAEPLHLRHAGRGLLLEVAALVTGLVAVSLVVFDTGMGAPAGPTSLLYLPLPFLLWAALRFGPALTSASYAIVALLAIWGAAHGRGPFQLSTTAFDPLPIQLFLLSMAVPLMMLAAVIEERRESERRLRASEELFSTAFREGPDAIAISRQRDGRIVEANDRWLQLLAYPPGTATAEVAPFQDHLDEPSRRRVRALPASAPHGDELEVGVRDRLGASHSALMAIASVEVGGEPCHLTILRDITQQRAAEKDATDQRRQLTHLTRVASLSDFSSTIAHELNQPLTAILANAQAALRFLQRDPPNVGEIKAILDEIADADKRAGLLIHHLRLLMKKGEEEFVQVDLNHLVADVLEFVRGEFLLRGVEVKTHFAPDLPQVRGDRVQLQQVVLNLVCNACDAMQGQPRERLLSVVTSQSADGSAQVMVSDTGPGIPPDRLERVFEPFYTTKESGLGMGLPICRRIVSAHGGVLSAQSRSGEGASFRMVLPAVSSGARHRDAGSTPTATAS